MKEQNLVPPYTNRGVQNTLGTGLRACVDWVQVTFKNVSSISDICDLLGLDFNDFIQFSSGKYGYDSHYRFGHIAIYYNSIPKQYNYYHLEVTGQGCREFEQFSKYDWVTMLGLMMMLDINITRFDIAVDDFEGYFSFNQLIKKIKKGHVRSKFKKSRIMEDVLLADGSTAGTTIYFGSPQSEIQIRIYDKYQERIANGFEITKGVDHWIRTEIQLRDKRAIAAVYELVENIYSVGVEVQRILSNYVNFCDPTHDSNKSRWPVSKFWTRFLDNVEPLKLTQVAPDATIHKVNKWFEHSVTSSFSLLIDAFGYDEKLIREWYEQGKNKRTKKHENMLNRFKMDRKFHSRFSSVDRDHLQFKLSGGRKGNKKESSGYEDSGI